MIGSLNKTSWNNSDDIIWRKSWAFPRKRIWDVLASDKAIGIQWNTPREYEALDGKGRKLLLYDRKQHAVTAEVEIQKVEKTNQRSNFSWTNFYASGTKRFFDPPIPLDFSHSIPDLKTLGMGRGSHRNITYEQYRTLTAGRSAAKHRPSNMAV